MTVDSIRLQNFRSYSDAGFEFEPGVNIIVGPNASGKTNLLEALLVALRGGSFRAKDSELPQFGESWGRIDVFSPEENRTVKLTHQENSLTKKEFEIKNQKLSRLSLQRTVPVVLFEPNHLLLLHGSPEARREYLDGLLEQLIPGFGKVRRDYRRTLAQRNALLKRGPEVSAQLFAWNVRLSEMGALIARHRIDLVEKINTILGKLYQSLASSDDSVSMRYLTNYDVETYSSSLLSDLEKRQSIDIERGFTTVGSHREDISVTFGGRSAPEVASRGETRTVLLALKIIELELIEKARAQKPILLLDDVFSELDGKRRKSLTQTLSGHQTFITTTDADIILHHFTDECRIIALK